MDDDERAADIDSVMKFFYFKDDIRKPILNSILSNLGGEIMLSIPESKKERLSIFNVSEL